MSSGTPKVESRENHQGFKSSQEIASLFSFLLYIPENTGKKKKNQSLLLISHPCSRCFFLSKAKAEFHYATAELPQIYAKFLKTDLIFYPVIDI